MVLHLIAEKHHPPFIFAERVSLLELGVLFDADGGDFAKVPRHALLVKHIRGTTIAG